MIAHTSTIIVFIKVKQLFNIFDSIQMDVPVIEPLENYEKVFNTCDEFNLYYAKNKESIDSQTTHKLNKRYHIEGYRITKIKGVLSLKKYNPETDKRYVSKRDREESANNEINQLQSKVDGIQKQLDKVIESVNNIIKIINNTAEE